jgi:hypothetical protein
MEKLLKRILCSLFVITGRQAVKKLLAVFFAFYFFASTISANTIIWGKSNGYKSITDATVITSTGNGTIFVSGPNGYTGIYNESGGNGYYNSWDNDTDNINVID